MIDLDELDTLQKLYAAHNKTHAQYVDARQAGRRKVEMQEEHQAIVAEVKELGGKHIAKGEALDETLPDELKDPVKLHYMSNSLLLEEVDGIQVSTIQVLRTGTFYHPAYGKFTISEATLENMETNFKAARPIAPTEMVVDWEHMSAVEPPVIAPAAGWVRSVFTNDSRLWATVGWTEEAVTHIENKQYRYISPEIDLNYRDKETNKNLGPTLLSIALTNRPFIEGMEPVVLSEELASMVFAEQSAYEEIDAVYNAYRALQPQAAIELPGSYIKDIYDDYVIAEEDGKLYKIPYAKVGDEVTFDVTAKQEVTLIKEYITLSELTDDLPDTSFAYIAPGGEKDEDGRTEPRSLRHLPYRDNDGKIDLLRLHDALVEVDQTNLSSKARTQAKQVLIKANEKGGQVTMSDEELRALFGLSDDDDVTALVTLFKAKADEDAITLTGAQAALITANEATTTAQKKVDEADADALVAQALTARKITPKMRDWARTEALRDADGFKAFVAVAEVVGPELGNRGDDDKGDSIKLSEMELTIAKVLGVTEEDMIKAKEAAQVTV